MNKLQSMTLASVLAFGSVHAAEEAKPVARTPEQHGRYVITFSPFARADTFLLDTETGKVWQLTKFTDLEGEPLVFKFLERIDSEAQLTEWAQTQILKIEQKKVSSLPTSPDEANLIQTTILPTRAA